MKKQEKDMDNHILNARQESLEFAVNTVEEILEATRSPLKYLEGESASIYKDLEQWGWFETYPLYETDNQSLYRRIIAMLKFNQIRNDHIYEGHGSDESVGREKQWRFIMERLDTLYHSDEDEDQDTSAIDKELDT